MSELKIGDKVRTLSVYAFNERFVKVGDEATVIDITQTLRIWFIYQFNE